MNNIISLDNAIAEIKLACDENQDRNGRTPFFFLVGAGISSPSIPLASVIQQHCEDKARSIGRLIDENDKLTKGEEYSRWFTAAFPHRILRQRYLRGLIEQAPITHANFRLADLLIQGRVSRIVVTPNFDDLLSRALTLFGENHLVCDDPRTVERIDPENPDIQLIHLHGSFWFYDCRNTSSEIQERSQPKADTTLTMAALLDKLLAARSPIVIGYSGWENDAFMLALKRRLLTSLPFNLYWFCHSRDDIDSLPSFLEHPDVYLVAPPEDNSSANANPSDVEGAAPSEPVFNSNTQLKSRLTATTVLDRILNQTGSGSPLLTRDPLAFFADRLRKALPPEDAENGFDVYSFRSVLQRVERAKSKEVELNETERSNHKLLESIRDAVRRAQYDEAYKLAEQVVLGQLTQEQMKDFVSTVDSATAAMGDQSALTPFMCDMMINCYKTQRNQGQEPLAKYLIDAANRKGNSAYAKKEPKNALDAYDIAFAILGNTTDQAVQIQLCPMRNNKGLALKLLSRDSDAIGEHDKVIDILKDSVEDSNVSTFVVALLFKAARLFDQKQFDDSLKVFSQAFARFEKIEKPTDYTKANLAAGRLTAEAVKVQIKAQTQAKALLEAEAQAEQAKKSEQDAKSQPAEAETNPKDDEAKV